MNFGPRTPAPVVKAAPKLPEPADPDVKDQARKRRRTELNRQGAGSTVLTSSSGVASERVRRKTLLGE